MKRSEEMLKKLKELNDKRKAREISASEYYRNLLAMIIELGEALKEENITEEEIKKQIPILRTFLMEQLKKMEGRDF